MIGPPGAGKSMLAQRLPTILPPMTLDESLDTTKIYSIDGRTRDGQSLIATRPFRSPHHTVSDVGLVGGGSIPKPGEVSLAHHGVLFLDELPQFQRRTLEVLRQPMEDGRVHISRAKMAVTFPSQFMLVCALNPGPCRRTIKLARILRATRAHGLEPAHRTTVTCSRLNTKAQEARS